jgi:hypothetical protein
MLYFLIHADVALQLLGQGDHWALNEHRPLHNTMPIQVSQNMQDKTEVQTGYHKRLPDMCFSARYVGMIFTLPT